MASTQVQRSTALQVIESTAIPRVTATGRALADCVLAFLLCVLLIPVFLVVAVAIKLSSPGPVFYAQERIGRGGSRFMFIKFRTMIPGADAHRMEVLGTPDDEMTERYKNDPRITSVGRVLRRWSLDELPQLINVVRGDMALVGPRPMLPEEVDLLEPRHHERHLCRPGLTGLWQVSGRKETSFSERMDLDLYYVHHKSIKSDVAILRRTVGVVLRGDGAY